MATFGSEFGAGIEGRFGIVELKHFYLTGHLRKAARSYRNCYFHKDRNGTSLSSRARL